MISEKQLAKGFDSFWQHHFPLLNPTYMRRFNAQAGERLLGEEGLAREPIPMGQEVERFDLVAEVAFELARERHERKGKRKQTAAAISRAVKRVAALEGHAKIPKPFPYELAEADALLTMYRDFFKTIASEGEIQFLPRIKGAGILDAMEGDFCTSTTLFEVKCVNRNLLSTDLRQLLCYLVAGKASREYGWTRYCIFNPRRGLYYSGRADAFIAYLSGRTPHECIDEVFDSLMQREQPLESSF